MQVLTVLELGIFATENPREHLSGLHARSDDTATLVPLMTAALLLSVLLLQSYLIQNADQQLVDVVIDAHRNLGIFYAECAS